LGGLLLNTAMTTYFRTASNSIGADEDRRAMGRAGLDEIVTVPYNGVHGSRYITFAKGEIRPGIVLPCAKLR
jgi:hypothetical protein